MLLNLGFLTFDIYLAHSVNGFRQRAEYIPLYFSALAPVLLLVGLAFQRKRPWLWKGMGHVVGWSAILIGLTGVVLHLDSSFFYERTIRSLTYSAPFAAPLAYTGLGFLLLLNRLQEPDSEEWARWVLFITLGGFIGNFVFSLTDHAGNGFFDRLEWVPVVASAIAVGFLVTPLLVRVSKGSWRCAQPCCCWMLESAFGVLYCTRNGIWPGRRSMPSIISSMAPHPWPRFCFPIWWLWDCWVCGDSAALSRGESCPSPPVQTTGSQPSSSAKPKPKPAERVSADTATCEPNPSTDQSAG